MSAPLTMCSITESKMNSSRLSSLLQLQPYCEEIQWDGLSGNYRDQIQEFFSFLHENQWTNNGEIILMVGKSMITMTFCPAACERILKRLQILSQLFPFIEADRTPSHSTAPSRSSERGTLLLSTPASFFPKPVEESSVNPFSESGRSTLARLVKNTRFKIQFQGSQVLKRWSSLPLYFPPPLYHLSDSPPLHGDDLEFVTTLLQSSPIPCFSPLESKTSLLNSSKKILDILPFYQSDCPDRLRKPSFSHLLLQVITVLLKSSVNSLFFSWRRHHFSSHSSLLLQFTDLELLVFHELLVSLTKIVDYEIPWFSVSLLELTGGNLEEIHENTISLNKETTHFVRWEIFLLELHKWFPISSCEFQHDCDTISYSHVFDPALGMVLRGTEVSSNPRPDRCQDTITLVLFQCSEYGHTVPYAIQLKVSLSDENECTITTTLT